MRTEKWDAIRKKVLFIYLFLYKNKKFIYFFDQKKKVYFFLPLMMKVIEV